MPTEPELVPPYRYYTSSNRYIDSRGRFVSRALVRKAVDGFIEGVKLEVSAHTGNLLAGRITLTEWEKRMQQTSKSAHVAAHAVGIGGVARMSASDYKSVAARVKSEYKYLNKLTSDVASGRVKLSSLQARALNYASAARSTYEQAHRLTATGGSLTRERNLLRGSNHCDECLALTRLGWQPIGSMKVPGERQCRRHCHCELQYGT